MALPRHVSHAPQQVWITNHQSSKSSAGLDHSPTPLHNDATDAHIEAHPHLFYQHFDQILSHDPTFQHSHDRGFHLLHRDHLHPVDWGATQHNSARTKALCHNRGIRIVTTEALKLSQPRYQNCVSTLSPIYQRETSINKKQQQKAYLINHPPKPVKKWIFVEWKDHVCVFKNFISLEQNSFTWSPKLEFPSKDPDEFNHQWSSIYFLVFPSPGKNWDQFCECFRWRGTSRVFREMGSVPGAPAWSGASPRGRLAVVRFVFD